MEPLRTSTGFTRSASARKRTAAAATASTPRCALRDTQLLRLEDRKFFTGSAKAFDATGSTDSLRFDPEGVRVSHCGRSVFVSDEYGPYLYEFDISSGKRLRSVNLPNKLLVDLPSDDPNTELCKNAFGRQSNRSMEGLAISPDGSRLYGMMQNALIQDGGLDGDLKRFGLNNRIVEIDVETGATREFVYVLDKKSYGVNEIDALNDHEFLVLERDSNAGTAAAFKRLFKIGIAGASDVRDVKQLPVSGQTAGVIPVAKARFLDLLDPAHGLVGATFPEKIEGLAFGPDLPDGRRMLVVTNDNDFMAANANNFYFFAIEPWLLPNYQSQRISFNHRCDRDDDHYH
ncbi:MAG TPA: esterase-like activity of phytase family protein [Burkholderiales bacterium]